MWTGKKAPAGADPVSGAVPGGGFRPATQVERNQLAVRCARLERETLHLPPYETLEYHLVHPKLPWDAGLRAVASIAEWFPRLRAAAVSGLFDVGRTPDGGPECVPPSGWRVPAFPVDLLATDEVYAFKQAGWRDVKVRRVWMADAVRRDDPEAEHGARIAASAARAGKAPWTYLRSTGWSFFYPAGCTPTENAPASLDAGPSSAPPTRRKAS